MRLIWSPEEFPCFTLICFAIPVQRAEMQHWQSFGALLKASPTKVLGVSWTCFVLLCWRLRKLLEGGKPLFPAAAGTDLTISVVKNKGDCQQSSSLFEI